LQPWHSYENRFADRYRSGCVLDHLEPVAV
jgi:hypothetical protein